MRPIRLPSVRWLAPAAFGVIASLSASIVALAGTLNAGTVNRVPDNPLAGSATCAAQVAQQEELGSVNFPDAEVEPYVAVDPTNPLHLVGSFQQDRWNDGGANGLTNVVSMDGGKTWSLAVSQPQFTICEGATPGSPGFRNRASDPWVSFSADGGVVYSTSLSLYGSPSLGATQAIIIARSTDGGVHWQVPVAAQVDTSLLVLNDKESVTADPVVANNAYAVWDRLNGPSQNADLSALVHTFSTGRGTTLFSRTTDKGLTWSPGREIFDPGERDETTDNQILVPTAGPASGILVDGMSLNTSQGGKCPITHGGLHCAAAVTFTAAVIRSTDGGNTWSEAIGIDVQQLAPVRIAGQPVRSGDGLPEFAVNPVNGNLYAVWQDSRFTNTGASKIAFSQSTDGGLTWSNTTRIDQSPGDTQAFVPEIHVAADGTIGLLYYDLEHATQAQPGLTDVFIAHCHSATSDCSNQASWAAGGETRLTTSGSFDYTTAAQVGGSEGAGQGSRSLFLGDYVGLTTSGNRFVAFFGMSQPASTAGRSDVFSNPAG